MRPPQSLGPLPTYYCRLPPGFLLRRADLIRPNLSSSCAPHHAWRHRRGTQLGVGRGSGRSTLLGAGDGHSHPAPMRWRPWAEPERQPPVALSGNALMVMLHWLWARDCRCRGCGVRARSRCVQRGASDAHSLTEKAGAAPRALCYGSSTPHASPTPRPLAMSHQQRQGKKRKQCSEDLSLFQSFSAAAAAVSQLYAAASAQTKAAEAAGARRALVSAPRGAAGARRNVFQPPGALGGQAGRRPRLWAPAASAPGRSAAVGAVQPSECIAAFPFHCSPLRRSAWRSS